jgi:hypothetical protein
VNYKFDPTEVNHKIVMLKQFPIKLGLKILITAILLLAVVRYTLFPVFAQVRYKVAGIWSFYSGADKEAALNLEKERAALLDLEQKVLPQTDPTKKSAGYYDFLQGTLKNHNIPAVKINSGEQITAKNIQQEDFSVNFSGTYLTIGLLVSDLENGPYFCSVKSLHVVSKSLLDNTLEAEISLSFFRLAK